MSINTIRAGIGALALIGGLAACGASESPAAAPTVRVTQTVAPTPTVTKTVTPPTPTPTVTKTVAPAPTKTVYVAPAPAAPAPQLLNAEAVVTQFYADINDGDFSDAWNLGGKNIGGSDYAGWVAGYDTTAGVALNTWSYFGSDQVTVQLVATQDDGAVYDYTGTYIVEGGQIVSADIVQN